MGPERDPFTQLPPPPALRPRAFGRRAGRARGRKGGGEGRSCQGFRPEPQSPAPTGASATYITNRWDKTLI